MSAPLVFGVSDFVAVFNQTIQTVYSHVTVQGELANFRVSKNRWVYFDLKDEYSSVKFFGSVYNLPGPLEEGMILKVSGTPQLHNLYGFSITVQQIQLAGEGTIKKAAQLLQAKLEKEGLFDPARKRVLPYPPARIGLITSGESAAYADFVKIISARWGGVQIEHYDVQVQGEDAPTQIVQAIEYFNSHAVPVDVLVITRGGGSADDLQAFSTEAVTRAVAASRIPTLVAIGHEVDISLAELAADQRASTPSNAAELLVPDKSAFVQSMGDIARRLETTLKNMCRQTRTDLVQANDALEQNLNHYLKEIRAELNSKRQVLNILNPHNALKRGYALVMRGEKYITFNNTIKVGEEINVLLYKKDIGATITSINRRP